MKDSMLDGLTIDDVINSVSDTETDNDTVFESLNKQKMFTLLQSMEEDKSIYELSIHEILDKLGLTWVDKRDKKGALWVIGDSSINDVIEFLKKYGFRFTFSAKGGRASKNMPAWFSTTKGNMLTGTAIESFKIIKKYGVLTNRRQPICLNYLQWFDNEPCYDLRHWKDETCQHALSGVTLDKNEVKILKDILTVDIIRSKDELLGIIDIGKGNIDDYGLVAELNSTKTMIKEARVLDWTYGKVLDIRQWNEDHTKCRKGITLDQGELEAFVALLQCI